MASGPRSLGKQPQCGCSNVMIITETPQCQPELAVRRRSPGLHFARVLLAALARVASSWNPSFDGSRPDELGGSPACPSEAPTIQKSIHRVTLACSKSRSHEGPEACCDCQCGSCRQAVQHQGEGGADGGTEGQKSDGPPLH